LLLVRNQPTKSRGGSRTINPALQRKRNFITFRNGSHAHLDVMLGRGSKRVAVDRNAEFPGKPRNRENLGERQLRSDVRARLGLESNQLRVGRDQPILPVEAAANRRRIR